MTTKKEILDAIREQCLDCCGGSWKEVKNCSCRITPGGHRMCPLYPFRFGTDPNPSKARQEIGMKSIKNFTQKEPKTIK